VARQRSDTQRNGGQSCAGMDGHPAYRQYLGSISDAVYACYQHFQIPLQVYLRAMTAIILSYSLKTREDIKFTPPGYASPEGRRRCWESATVYFPHQLDIFFIPRNELMTNNYADTLENMDELSRRATGSIGIVATALILVNLTLLSMSRWFFDNKKTVGLNCLCRLHYRLYGGSYVHPDQRRDACGGGCDAVGLFFSKKKSAFGYLILVGVLIRGFWSLALGT